MARLRDALARPRARTAAPRYASTGRAFPGADPRGRPEVLARAVDVGLDPSWRAAGRYDRRAVVVARTALTPTGTVRLRLRVTDGRPFSFSPGQFVGIKATVHGGRVRRGPYCILSAPGDEPLFELLVRVVTGGSLSHHLASLRPGDVVEFRGPTGRSMEPGNRDRDLVLLATGVGVAPFLGLAHHLLESGFDRPVRLFWGLRLAEDVCLTDELDDLVRRFPSFSYEISLSQPHAGWTGLRGRVTESVPPLLDHLGGTQFHLCGNGAMIEEFAQALSDLGVSAEYVYKEPYFAMRARPDADVLEAVRRRFVARDLFSPWAHQQSELFHLERPLANADPAAGSDVVRRVPASVLSRAARRSSPRPTP